MIWIFVAIPWFLENHQEKKEQISAVCAYHWIHFIEDIETYSPIFEEIKNKLLEICPEILIIDNDELEEIKKNRWYIVWDSVIFWEVIRALEEHIKKTTFILETRETIDFSFIERWKKNKWFSSPQDIFRNPKANMWVKSRKQKR